MRRRPALLGFLGAFVATLLVRLPAAWVLPLAGLACDAPSGSAWRGGCRGLHLAGTTIESATWQLHPLALLRARLAADVQADDARIAGRARVELAPGGGVRLEQVSARLAIDADLAAAFPRGWAGLLDVSLDTLQLASGRPTGLQGTVRAQALRRLAPALALGDYVLRFPGGADASGRQAGQLADEGGPLALSGELRIDAQGQYELEGRVAARPEAPADLARSLEILGPADAEGRRPFSLAGVF